MVSRGLGKTAQKEAFVVDVAEGAGPVERLHNLVLALTGRVDDDAVNSVREMLGIGQLDAAAEFLAGCLLAGRIPVTSTEQYHLRRALEEARSQQALADRLHVVEAVPDEGHRFSDEHDQDRSDRELVDALAPIAGRLHGVRALWCAWRTTPAGRGRFGRFGSRGRLPAAGGGAPGRSGLLGGRLQQRDGSAAVPPQRAGQRAPGAPGPGFADRGAERFEPRARTTGHGGKQGRGR